MAAFVPRLQVEFARADFACCQSISLLYYSCHFLRDGSVETANVIIQISIIDDMLG